MRDYADEIDFLSRNLHFEERPASIIEFVGENYLNIERGIRTGVMSELVELFGTEVNPHRIAKYRWGMFTGAIGIGKTTMASIILPYMTHWVLCLRDPQGFYDLLPGSRIAFMQMSTSEDQAVETVFGDIKARIEHSRWFNQSYPYDNKFTKQMRFPQKDIWILPGSSLETAFEGYNILGGILDEADSHKVTKEKDYADVGWDTINSRIDSRFQDRGFLLTVGQMKKANGFAKKKYEELNRDPENAHTVRMTIWESLGWDHKSYQKADGSGPDYFWYDKSRKEIVPNTLAELIDAETDNLIKVPTVYKKAFETNPEKALRDLAGIPPATGDPFISLVYKIEDCVTRWKERYPDRPSPVNEDPVQALFADWFVATDPLKRVLSLDMAYSADGDALGMSMGHVAELVTNEEGEEKPHIVVDFMMRLKAAPGSEILFQDVRRRIYDLRDKRKFRIRRVTMDGFQSTDTRQQLMKNKIDVEYLSVDKSKLPYEDLRDAIYEDRLDLPPYVTYYEVGGTEKGQIAVKELSEIEDTGRKIDHPVNGSKDVADTLAALVTTLMVDRQFQRGVRSRNVNLSASDESQPRQAGMGNPRDLLGLGGLRAPSVPQAPMGTGLQMPLPPGFMGR